MMTSARTVLAVTAMVALALSGCAAEGPSSVGGKPGPEEDKLDAVSRLCADAGLPDNCDICEHRGWYGDGVCDDFCAGPDQDCAPAPGECSYDIASPVTDSSSDLRELVVGAVHYGPSDVGDVPVVHARQIFEAMKALDFDVDGEDFDVVFELADDGEITVSEVVADGTRYDWVSFYAGDTEVGVVFRSLTVEVVAEVSDGDIMGCAPAGTDPDPEPGVQCHWDNETPFGDSSDNLEDAARSTRRVTMDDMASLSELESRQIFLAAQHLEFLVGDEDFDVVFDVADEGEYFLADVVVGGTSFDWIKLYAGDTEVGVVFADGTTTIIAEIGDGDVMGCVVEGSEEPVLEPVEVQCNWDYTSELLPETSGELADSIVATRTYYIEDIDALTELERRQIFTAMVHTSTMSGDEDFDAVFAMVDDGSIEIADVQLAGTSFDWIVYYSGDTEVGAVFEDGTLRILGEVGDGDIKFCR